METHIDFFVFSPPRSGSTLLCALISSETDVLALNDTFIFRQYSEHSRYIKKKSYKKLTGKIKNKMKKAVKIVSPNVFKKARLSKEYVSTPESYIPETSHLPHPDYAPKKSEVLSYVEALIERLERPLYIIGQKKKSWKKIYTRKLTPDRVWREYNEKGSSIRDLVDIVFKFMVPQKYDNKRIYGEKTPFHLHYSKWIREMYDEPKKIILIRHPVTTISSILERSSSTLRDAINQHMSYFHESYDELYNSKNTLLLKYEDLISEPKKELYRIHSFLGSNIKEQNVDVKFDYEFGHGYVGKGIDKSRNEKRKSDMTKGQKKKIRNRCAKVIDEFY